MQARHGDLLQRLRTEKLSDELSDELAAAVDAFKETFEASVVKEEEPGPNAGWDAMAAKDDDEE